MIMNGESQTEYREKYYDTINTKAELGEGNIRIKDCMAE